MEKEIAESGINPFEVCKLMYGGHQPLENSVEMKECSSQEAPKIDVQFRKTLKMSELKSLFEDPVIQNPYHRTELDRNEAFKASFRKLNRLIYLSRDKKVPPINYLSYTLYTYPMGGLISTSVGHGMFETLIRYLGTDEQIKTYVQDLLDYKIMGCYSQTEIGHGSDVRSLQTTATYDSSEDCFIVNTPTLKDAKFWPGELGKVATHAVFQAKTILNGEDKGIQSFVCQIRHLDDHRPLKGLEIGDIGPKYGYASKDNGYLMFNNFKIPRSAMLSRYTEVTKEGVLISKGDPRIAYAAMMLIRIQLINSTPAYFIKALILSFRYLLERVTTDSSNFYSKFDNDGSLKNLSNVELLDPIPRPIREYRVIDYQATKNILIPACAFAWVSRFTSYKCFEMYDKMNDNIRNGDFNMMKDLHSLACAIKAYYMDEIINQLKTVRECMGGHGYLSSASLPELIEMASPNSTLEGDIAVMYQQTARDIFKSVGRIMSGKTITGTFSYLNDLPNYIDSKFEKEEASELSDFIEILKATTILQIIRVGNELRKDESISFDTRWNKLYLYEIIKTSKLHSIYISAVNCYEGLHEKKMSEKLRHAIELICKIYACDNIVKFSDQALLDGYINGKILFGIQEKLSDLIEQFRPYLAVMTEPLSVCEGSIDGILSQKDGKTYERIYTESSRSAVNSKTVIDSVADHVKPLSKLLQLHYKPTAKI